MRETYVTHDTLVILEKKLPQASFMRVHRSFIANINHITEIQPWFNSTYNLIMKEGSKVPVSRTYAKNSRSASYLRSTFYSSFYICN